MSGPLMSLGERAIASASRRVPAAIAALAAAIVVCWHPQAHAQLSGQVNVYGSANVARLGNSVLVTTTNGADNKHSVIDWNAFSVPKNSLTHFQQPSADSTSINRVTGGKRSDIFGSLSSNGHLVLVNPAGIAFGENASVDTASFTASTLAMTDEDAVAGRMRFSAGKQTGKLTVDASARILARRGDVVLLGTDISIEKPKSTDKPRKDDKDDKDKKDKKDDKKDRDDANDQDDTAQVWAPNGSIIIAAGQRVLLTGRGLEGIVLELTSSKDKLVNLGRLEGDAVGLFASQLEHSGIVKAQKVVLQDAKVRLERGGKDDDKGNSGNGSDKGNGDDANSGNGNSGNGNSGNGNSGSGNSGTGSSGTGSSGNGNSGNGNGNGNSGTGSADSGSGSSNSGSSNSGSSNSGSANSGGGSCTGTGSGVAGCTDATLTLGGGTIVIAPEPVPTPPVTTGGTSVPAVPAVVDPAPVVQPVLVTALSAPAAVTTQLSASVINDYQAPAVTPAQSLDASRQQDRFAAVRETPKEDSAAAQCVR